MRIFLKCYLFVRIISDKLTNKKGTFVHLFPIISHGQYPNMILSIETRHTPRWPLLLKKTTMKWDTVTVTFPLYISEKFMNFPNEFKVMYIINTGLQISLNFWEMK